MTRRRAPPIKATSSARASLTPGGLNRAGLATRNASTPKRSGRHGRQLPIGGLVAAAELPIGPEDAPQGQGEKGGADAQAGLLDMGQRAPVEILAADENFTVIDDEILGVQNAAGQLFPVEQPDRDVQTAAETLQRFRVSRGHGLFTEDADLHSAPAGGQYGFDHRFKRFTFFRGEVEFGEFNGMPGAFYHLQPNLGGIARSGTRDFRSQAARCRRPRRRALRPAPA